VLVEPVEDGPAGQTLHSAGQIFRPKVATDLAAPLPANEQLLESSERHLAHALCGAALIEPNLDFRDLSEDAPAEAVGLLDPGSDVVEEGSQERGRWSRGVREGALEHPLVGGEDVLGDRLEERML